MLKRRSWIAALAVAAATSFAHAAPPPTDIDFDNPSFWDWLCFHTTLTNTVALPCTLTAPQMVSTTAVLKGANGSPMSACCGASITQAVGQEYSYSGTFSIPLGCEDLNMQIGGTVTGTWESQITYQAPICGCVQLMMTQRYCVFMRAREAWFCGGTGMRTGPIYRLWERIKVPYGTPMVTPYYYKTDPNNCPCNGNPTETIPGLPSPLPTLAPGPSHTERPWNTDTDGPPLTPTTDPNPADPNSPNAKPPKSSIEVDLSPALSDRKIESSLDLNLFEIRLIVFELNRIRSENPLLTDATQVRVDLNDSVSVQGSIGALVKNLASTAKAMVWSKSYADFNGDSTIDSNDLNMLMARVATPSDPPDMRRYDLNGDGAVDMDDVNDWWSMPL